MKLIQSPTIINAIQSFLVTFTKNKILLCFWGFENINKRALGTLVGGQVGRQAGKRWYLIPLSMIDPARALSLCHPIATFFITLLLASPALPLRPHRRRRSPRRLLPPPFFCSVAQQIANSFTEIFGLLIPIFVAVVVGFCGCSSFSLQQRLNSKKSLVHYSRRCVVICEGGGDSSRRGSNLWISEEFLLLGEVYKKKKKKKKISGGNNEQQQ